MVLKTFKNTPMLGSTTHPSVPGWGPRACILRHRVRSPSPFFSSSPFSKLISHHVPPLIRPRVAWPPFVPGTIQAHSSVGAFALPVLGRTSFLVETGASARKLPLCEVSPDPPHPFPRDAAAKTADRAGSRRPRLSHSSGS